jgi:hypothetical protein
MLEAAQVILTQMHCACGRSGSLVGLGSDHGQKNTAVSGHSSDLERTLKKYRHTSSHQITPWGITLAPNRPIFLFDADTPRNDLKRLTGSQDNRTGTVTC